VGDVVGFVGVVAVIVVLPGPDMALVLQNGLTRGRRAAVETAVGINAGLLVWAVAAALGIAALLHASAPAFTLLKLAGAAYLVFLGLRALGDAWRGTGDAPSSAPGAAAQDVAVSTGPALEPPEPEDRARLHDPDPAVRRRR
jgi:threonine/homoserine/homoserine lactone efflux protein